MVGWLMTVFYVREVQAKEGWADMGMLTGLSFDPARSRLTIRSNGKLRAVVDALRVEASGGTEIVGWSRRRVGRFGGISGTTFDEK